MNSPQKMVIAGFLLALTGAVLPFLMVIKVIDASLILSFVAYGSSVAGLMLGVLGAGAIARERHHEPDELKDESAHARFEEMMQGDPELERGRH